MTPGMSRVRSMAREVGKREGSGRAGTNVTERPGWEGRGGQTRAAPFLGCISEQGAAGI